MSNARENLRIGLIEASELLWNIGMFGVETSLRKKMISITEKLQDDFKSEDDVSYSVKCEVEWVRNKLEDNVDETTGVKKCFATLITIESHLTDNPKHLKKFSDRGYNQAVKEFKALSYRMQEIILRQEECSMEKLIGLIIVPCVLWGKFISPYVCHQALYSIIENKVNLDTARKLLSFYITTINEKEKKDLSELINLTSII